MLYFLLQLPEQYRIDPPSQETRSHHRKKKHKHKNLDKTGEDGSDFNPPSTKVKMPGDAYSFVKQEPSSSPFLPTSTHGYPPQPERAIPQKAVSGGHIFQSTLTACKLFTQQPLALSILILATPAIVSNTTVIGHDPLNPFPGGKKKKVNVS